MALTPKRSVIAHLVVCLGCCCGRTDRGRPEVPVDWLKAEWKSRGLLRHVHLTISGCLGPCELANVVTIADSAGTMYLGGLSTRAEYQALVEWAESCVAAGSVQPLPRRFEAQQVPWIAPAECAPAIGAP